MIADNKPPIICVMGPTASGKTSLAIALAKQFPIEVINVDSAQIYKEMDIGTGKPALLLREKIPHHLMDFLDPKIPYSAAQFRLDAQARIKEILARKAVPLLVGGTMLYFKVLQEGISALPDRNEAIRSRLEQKAKEIGWPALHQHLAEKDAIAGRKINPCDPQRISRALEIIEITGLPLSYWWSQAKEQQPYQFINIGLIPITTPRSVLHDRIEQRFDAMLSQGFVAEVENLKARGDLTSIMPSIRAVGYRQLWQYLQHELTYDEMREKAIAATRQLAKRQLTWLRKWPGLIAYDFCDPEVVNHIKNDILNKCA